MLHKIVFAHYFIIFLIISFLFINRVFPIIPLISHLFIHSFASVQMPKLSPTFCWRSLSLITFALLLMAQSLFAFRTQSTAARGQLLCGGRPARGVLVKLFDEDDGPDPDDELDNVHTDLNGEFEVSGSTMELTNIDPELRIYHDCNMHIPLCKREWVIGIPDKYISSGTRPKKVMNFGSMELEAELEDESRDCIH